MIRFGDRLPIVVLCPDCEKPMANQFAAAYKGIVPEVDSNFTIVHCTTEICINRFFMTTIEKKTGVVIFTDARYRLTKESEWEPVFVDYKTEAELKK